MHPHLRQLVFILLAATALFMFVAPTLPVFAQDYIPLAPIEVAGMKDTDKFTSCTPGTTYDSAGAITKEADCLPKYLTTLYNMGIALAGLFLVFAIVRGGFTLMFTDSVLGKLEGKKIILQAMGGAVIVFSSYLLMNTINPQLAQDLNLSLKFPRVVIQPFESLLEAVEIEKQIELGKEAKAIRKDIEDLEKDKKDGKISGTDASQREFELKIAFFDQVIKDAKAGMTREYNEAKKLLRSSAVSGSPPNIRKVESEVMGTFLRHANVAATTLAEKRDFLAFWDATDSELGAITREINLVIKERGEKRQALVNLITYRKRCPFDVVNTTGKNSPCSGPPVMPT